jgi:hypothetical protein
MSVRTGAVRWLLGRLAIDDDIVRHLSTFQRLGETLEVQSPREMLPIGARTVFRALRTRAAAQLGPDWVWPWWLQQQIDPLSPAFVPRGHLPFLTNLTARNWTAVGNLDSPWEAIVDPRGLVTPWFDGWSLDWWVGDGERWHVPSRAEGVRQGLLDAMPVVETVLPVGGGEVVHRVWAVDGGPAEATPRDARGGTGAGGGTSATSVTEVTGAASTTGERVVVEVENRCAISLSIAFAVRPYNPEGLAVVEQLAIGESEVTVNGRLALFLPGPPTSAAASTFHDGDCSGAVFAGIGRGAPLEVRDVAGMAQGAVVYPLPPGERLRVEVPVLANLRPQNAAPAPRITVAEPAAATSREPAAVARRWRERAVERGMRLSLPDSRLAEAVDANRAFLVLLHDGRDITPGPTTYHRFWFRDAAFMLAALDRYGLHEEAATVLATYGERQHADGFFFSQRHEWDANGCALWSLAEHWRMTRDRRLVEPFARAITRGAEWIERKRRQTRRADPAFRGMLPAGVSAEHLGPFDYYYWDDFWGIAGLDAAAELLASLGDRGAADLSRSYARDFRRDLDASLALVAARLGSPALPAGPRRRLDAGVIGSLVGCEPLRLLAADHPAVAATAELVRQRFCLGEAFFQGISHTGLGTYLTLQLAFVELAAGDPRAWGRLRWMLDAATSTWTWPEAIHPRLPGGCMGDGHHGWAAADFLSFVRMVLVREVPAAPDAGPPALALCSLLPEEWRGGDLAVEAAPTWYGALSYDVRWRGDRPTLRWDLRPHPDLREPVRLLAPGLDPSWETTAAEGEVVLGAVAAER